MPVSVPNRLVFQKLTGIVLLTILTACSSSSPRQTVDSSDLSQIADELHTKGNDEAAADFYSRALKKSPDDTELRRKFGELLESHNDLNGAATQYRSALGLSAESTTADIPSTDTALLRDYGRVLIKSGKPDQAQPVYVRALQIDPDDVRSLNGLGVCLDQLNNHEAAQKIYSEALADKPDDVGTLANLGHSYVLSGAYENAIKLLEPHLNDRDATPALRQNLAEAYGMDGMDADAERVSRYDLPPAQIKHNLAYYRLRRAHLGPAAGLYADLGHFPTAEMAAAHADAIRAHFPHETDSINIAATPNVAAIGGTPSFTVRATGFAKAATLHAFCLKLTQQQFACVAETDK